MTSIREAWIDAGLFTTRYLVGGDPANQCVLFLHDGAYGASADVTWGSTMERLVDRFHVIAPDMLGFGGTDKAVFLDRAAYKFRTAHVRKFLEELGITEPVHVVGNSFGGSLALRALGNPEAWPIRSVVSVAGSGGPWRTDLAKEQLANWDGTRDDMARIMRLIVDEGPDFDDWVDLRTSWAQVPGHYRAIKAASTPMPEALRRQLTDDWPAPLGASTQPVMLVNGTRDVLLEQSWTAHLAAAAPRVRICDMDAKHAPNVDHADEFAGHLIEFFAGIE